MLHQHHHHLRVSKCIKREGRVSAVQAKGPEHLKRTGLVGSSKRQSWNGNEDEMLSALILGKNLIGRQETECWQSHFLCQSCFPGYSLAMLRRESDPVGIQLHFRRESDPVGILTRSEIRWNCKCPLSFLLVWWGPTLHKAKEAAFASSSCSTERLQTWSSLPLLGNTLLLGRA